MQCQNRKKITKLKESVANDVINVSLFANDKITLKTLNDNKRRQDIDKSVWESKKYAEDFQKRLRTTRSIEQAPGSGRPRTTRTAENVVAVGDLVQSQENQPQTHRSTRQISRNTSNK